MVQNELEKQEETSKGYYILLVLAILFVGFNLRPAITSVGPLIGTIRDDVGFANWNVALLTSLPLIAFMLISPIAPKIAHKWTNELTLSLGLFILVVGIGLRFISSVTFLFLGTFLIGTGIAICNVLLPSVIKDKFPYKVAIMTSLYTTSMVVFATISSGLSVPLADNLQLGWELSLLVWIVPALVGLVIWLIVLMKNNQRRNDDTTPHARKEGRSGIWQEALAWKVALFMGLQSFIFYVMVSWLPEILHFYGMAKASAGFMLSYFQLIGIPVTFMVPMIVTRMKNQRLFVAIVNIIFIIGLIILLLSKSTAMIIVATTLLGAASSSNFALALTFLSIRAKNARDAAELSGMAQSIGYCVAAFGPIFIGFLFDVTQSWMIPLLILIGVMIVIIYFGLQAGKNEVVFDND